MAESTGKAAMKRYMTEPNTQQEIYDREHRNPETLQAAPIVVCQRGVWENCSDLPWNNA